MGKHAILQMSDEPQITSTAEMLRAAGFDKIQVCGPELRDALRKAGCDTVIAVEQMERMGYDRLAKEYTEASVRDLFKCDLFVEIKVRNVGPIVAAWPRLKGKVAYWRVNGAQPEVCPKGGDEVNLPCPVITACLWYGTPRYSSGRTVQVSAEHEHGANRPVTEESLRETSRSAALGDSGGMAYTFWPPYPGRKPYDAVDRTQVHSYAKPFCVCHSVGAWGYGPLVADLIRDGVRFYGNNSPAGQVPHSAVPGICRNALACVHLKSVDCPGWALYEAILSGVPVVTGRLLNSRMLAYDLLEHGETCLEFGVPASLEYGRGDMDYPKCLADIREALERLKDRAENLRIGENGRRRLNSLIWTEAKDGDGFRAFMRRHFG